MKKPIVYRFIEKYKTSILTKLGTWCFEHSDDISCSLLVNPSHTDESWAGRNTCMWIYIYIYMYVYIYICVCVCVYIYICVCVCVCVYIYKYIHIYSNSKKAINANCLNVNDPLLLCKKDSQGVVSNI